MYSLALLWQKYVCWCQSWWLLMIGEIRIETKGTIGDCARRSERISEDLRHIFLLPGNRGSIWFFEISVKSHKRLISNFFSWRALSSIASLSGRETIWRSEWSCSETVSGRCEQKKLDLNWIWTQPKLIWPHRQIWPNQTSRCGGWKYVRKRL